MAKTVLIVEDKRAIVEILKFNLKREGYETLEALDGETGLLLAQTKDPDLILLDVMLPKLNGFDICKTLRAENRTTPIIMLTAREEEMDKVFGLETGADDYMTKPFSMKELMARVKANIRRRSMEYTPATPAQAANTVEAGGLAQFATIANRQPFPVHFDYQGSRLDAKSILSLCALPLEAPVRVVLPEQVSCERFLADIQSFLCDPAAE